MRTRYRPAGIPCVGLEHLPLRAEHREHTALVVVGVLVARAVIRRRVVLVGPHHLGQVAVAVVEAALHPAVLLHLPDLSMNQIG